MRLTITIIFLLFMSLSLPGLALASCQSITIHTAGGFKFCTQCCNGGTCHITCM